jgi:large subunit ribosomal protein L25
MTDHVALAAEKRSRVGKGGARACRRAGFVPGVIYGDGKDPTAIAVSAADLNRHLKQQSFMNQIVELDLGGAKERVLPRDVQLDALSSAPVHVDFLRVSASSQVSASVTIVFINEDRCPGLKKGGVLNIVEHAIEVVCRPDVLPERLAVDLADLQIGDVIHDKDLPLPDGVRLARVIAGNTIASIASPTKEAAPEAEDAEAGDGETAESTA